MKKTFPIHLLGAFALLAGSAAYAQDISGDWQGTLKAGPTELRIQLHLTKADNGFKATMDSVDQGANGIPVDMVKLDGATLKFTVDTVQGTYEGKVSADGSSISGNWSQGQPLPLNFTRGTFKAVERKPGKPSDIDGKWMGSLDTPQGSIRVVFNIVNMEDGLSATTESPDQGPMVIPVNSVTRNGSSLKLEIKGLAAVYEGTISPDLKTVNGTLTQGGNSTPLVLKK